MLTKRDEYRISSNVENLYIEVNQVSIMFTYWIALKVYVEKINAGGTWVYDVLVERGKLMKKAQEFSSPQ
jgi:hypothetical protein